MATTTGTQATSTSQLRLAGKEGRSGPSPGRPYSVREAAALLGVSQDAIEANYQQLEGFRVGRRILVPRRVVDRLVGAPPNEDDEHRDDQQQTPTVERVLALLPLLARDERVKVAQAALAAELG